MKTGVAISSAKLAAAGAVAAGLTAGGALLLFSVSIDITPKSTQAEAPAQPEPASKERRLILQGLRDLIESSRAVISVAAGQGKPGDPAGGFGGQTTSIVLWTRDRAGPGVVNLDELLVLSHRPVLGAITATTFGDDAGDDRPGPPVPVAALFAPDPVEALRGAAGAVTRVIATDVRDVSVEQAASTGGMTQLTLTLTWDDDGADARGGSVVSAVAPRWRRP